MVRRSCTSSVALLLLVALSCAACGDRRAWQQPTWRPAAPPQRVVLASVLAAESLLGVLPEERIAAVHHVAADPGYSLVAATAGALPQVGARPEELLSVRPDLVLVDAYTRAETLALLAEADVPVVRTRDPHDFADVEANLLRLGQVCHVEDGVARVVDRLRRELADVRRTGAGLGGWRLLSLDGALHTYGDGSLFDAIASAAGARNLAAEHGVGLFRKLDVEEVLAWRPDAIVLAGASSRDGEHPQWIAQWPGLELLPCVQKGRLLFVPGPLLSTTSHRLVDAARHVQQQLERWGLP